MGGGIHPLPPPPLYDVSISLLTALGMKFKTIVEPLLDGQLRGRGGGHFGEL